MLQFLAVVWLRLQNTTLASVEPQGKQILPGVIRGRYRQPSDVQNPRHELAHAFIVEIIEQWRAPKELTETAYRPSQLIHAAGLASQHSTRNIDILKKPHQGTLWGSQFIFRKPSQTGSFVFVWSLAFTLEAVPRRSMPDDPANVDRPCLRSHERQPFEDHRPLPSFDQKRIDIEQPDIQASPRNESPDSLAVFLHSASLCALQYCRGKD